MRSLRRSIVGLAAFAALCFAATGASAHAHLLSSSPAANATVAAPATIILTFSDPLEPRFSGFEITDARGDAVNAPSLPDAGNPAVFIATPAAPLAPGLYHVSWHLVAHDGHRMRGSFDFTVRP